jgi:hypothetical protein
VSELIRADSEEADGEGEEEDDLHAHGVPTLTPPIRDPPTSGREILAKRRSDRCAIRPAMDGDTVDERAQ